MVAPERAHVPRNRLEPVVRPQPRLALRGHARRALSERERRRELDSVQPRAAQLERVLPSPGDPAVPGTVYAGTAAAIYKSADSGQSWTELQANLYVSAIAVDPRAPSTLYAATHMGVMKSTDGGAKWSALRLASSPAEDPAGDPPAEAAGPLGQPRRSPEPIAPPPPPAPPTRAS